MKILRSILVCLLVLPLSTTLADKVTLRDGTVLEGTAIKQSDGYWFKGADGASRQIPFSDIESVQKSAPPAGTPKPTAPATPVKPRKPGAMTLGTARARAEMAATPVAAVAIWQEFIDSGPSAEDLKVAQGHLARWQGLADGNAEKINGRWVGGDELKTILDKARALTDEAQQLLAKQQTIPAVKKLEEAAKIYPNSFVVNFQLGYVALLERDTAKAVPYFETALKQKPDSQEALANMGLALVDQKQWEKGIDCIQKAIDQGDTLPLAVNLNVSLTRAPVAMRQSARMKPAVEAAALLAQKYNLVGQVLTKVYFIQLKPESTKGDSLVPEARMMASGTGFLLTSDGLILTNRHVVKGFKTYMVVMKGDVKKSAEIVAIDDEQDLALIRVKGESGKPLPTVRLAAADAPGDGAECTVIGYPLIDRMGAAAKITRGIVSSAARQIGETDVVIDAKVNPGNSGGPILDKYGNVMAIVAMKSLASTTEDSYGLGISAGRIRKFLVKNHVTVEKGEAGPATLSAEEIASRVEPATVCILSTK